MRSGSHPLRRDRKGVISLPIRLMLVVMIISVSLPIVCEALDENEKDISDIEMNREKERILDAMAAAHYSGTGSSRTVTVDVPSGCEIRIGGEGIDSMSVRSYHGGELTSTEYFERPDVRISEETVITGYMTLMLRSIDTDGVPGIEVSII